MELIARLVDLVRCGNELTAELLAHLAELEARMIHLELGYPSAFAYYVEALGFSEGAAGRRLTAARVCRRFPEGFELIARGDLHLSALCALAPHLSSENANDLLGVCRRKTRRQVDELIAARFPRPYVREQIRQLPVRSQQAGANAEDSEIARAAPAALTPSTAPPVGPLAAPPMAPSSSAPRRPEFEALSAERFGVHFTTDTELRDLIDRARALASHRLPQRDLSTLMSWYSRPSSSRKRSGVSQSGASRERGGRGVT